MGNIKQNAKIYIYCNSNFSPVNGIKQSNLVWPYNTIKSLKRHTEYEQGTPHHTGEYSRVSNSTIPQGIGRHRNIVDLSQVRDKTCRNK